VSIQDFARLSRAIGVVMTRLGMPFGPMLPDRLAEEVGRLPGVIKELELSTAPSVHGVLAMFESHYQGLDRMALSGSWAFGISDTQCDKLEEDCAAFTRDMADTALKDLELLPEGALEDPGSYRASA
jgi:hypothetical protein